MKVLLFILIISLLSSCTNKQEKWTEPITQMEFVYIKSGSFLMGDEKIGKQSTTIEKGFWLATTEVTQQQWKKIMGDVELHPEKPSPFWGKNLNYPKVSISYLEVEVFLKKLSNQSSTSTFRLPTEAEWEYACRAGSNSIFNVGDMITGKDANINTTIPSILTVKGNSINRPTKVASYKPNAWGLYDMHGNAWEWVSNRYDLDTIQNKSEKIIRGGSWFFGAENARSGKRRTHTNNLWGHSIGFRIVREPKN